MLMLELIAHALMPLMNTHASVAKARYSMQSCKKKKKKKKKKKQIKHSSENRVDPNQSNSLSENMLIHVPYESISLHTQHWHYFKIIRFLFNYIFFFQKIYSDTPSVWIHLKFRILSRLIWVHLIWKNNHQKTHACNNKKRYDSELPYQRPDLIEVMEIEIDLTTSTKLMFILVSI